MAITFTEGRLTFTVDEELLAVSSMQLIGDLSGNLGYRLHPATSKELVQRLVDEKRRGHLPESLPWPAGTTYECRATPMSEQGPFDKWRIYVVLPENLGEVHHLSAGAEHLMRSYLEKPDEIRCPTRWTISVECAAGVVSAYPCRSGAQNISLAQYASVLREYGASARVLFQLPEPIIGFVPPRLLPGLVAIQQYGLESQALAWRRHVGR